MDTGAPYVLSEHEGFYRGRELIMPASQHAWCACCPATTATAALGLASTWSRPRARCPGWASTCR